MYYLNTDLLTYREIVQCLHELRPEIAVDLVETDMPLQALGFVKSAPCVISINLNEEEKEELEDELDALEIYVASNDYISPESEEWKNYARYNWLFRVLRAAGEEPGDLYDKERKGYYVIRKA